jgi:hypothetical protein
VRRLAGVGLVGCACALAAQEPPADASELLDALLLGLLEDHAEPSPEALQAQVAEIGGIAFRSPVSVDYLDRAGVERYLGELIDTEYPAELASADARTLVAFDLLPAGTDLRALRARLLIENVVGFYDERPGRKRLFAISSDRSLTPMNRIVLVHELRHALQDQYADVHGALPRSVGDFDDRRLAFLSLLEGDATLVMTRYLERLFPAAGALSQLSLPDPPLAGAPPVLRDQLVRPYVAGLGLAREIERRGGWGALREAWSSPPRSSEQVLHPEKYFAGEAPLPVSIPWQSEGARLLLEGVLGEILIGTLLGAEGEATRGWGGDLFRTWDVDGRTLLVWRALWDTPRDEAEFRAALLARFGASHGPGEQQGRFRVSTRGEWRVAIGGAPGATLLVAADAPRAFEFALAALALP